MMLLTRDLFHVKQPQEKQGESSRLISQHLDEIGVAISIESKQKLYDFADLVRHWNGKINLVAQGDEQVLIRRHILNSLSLAVYIGVGNLSGSVLDIGTGAGFPGIPMKIVNADSRFTLLDSNQKKIFFVKNAIRHLALESTETVNIRLKKDMNLLGESFDVVVARAVAPLELLVGLARPLLDQNGKMYFLKGRDISEEIDNLRASYKEHDMVIETSPLSSYSSSAYAEQSIVVTIQFPA